MKKMFILCLALVMTLTLAGCYRAKMLFADEVKTMEVEGWAVEKDALPPEEVPPTCGELPAERVPQWGLTFEIKAVTAKGMTLVIRQEGGVELTGQINTGTPYGIKMREGDTWVDAPLLREDIVWNTVAYPVPTGGELEQELNWSQLYGELPAGEYLLVKSFMDFRATGDYDTFTFSVPFTVE